MKHVILLISLFVFLFNLSYSQDKEVKLIKKSNTNIYENSPVVNPTKVSRAIYFDSYGPLRDLPKVDANYYLENKEKQAWDRREKEATGADYSNCTIEGLDPVWQKTMGNIKNTKGILQNFRGQDSPYYPSDCNGTVGPNHFMQTINTTYEIYDKTGTSLAGPTAMNLLFSGVPGSSRNDGDPLILWDEQAQKWLAVEFSYSDPSGIDYMLIAVSQTNDPTGLWWRWSFIMTGMPDYEKIGIWEDGYYMATNTQSGDDVYVFERQDMITGGGSPQMIQFNNPNRPSGFHCIMPFDCDGTYAPSGTPGQYITISNADDELWVFEADINWTSPPSSTFARTQRISVSAFDSQFNAWGVGDIAQSGTTQLVDANPYVLQIRAQYKNWGTSQSIVCVHVVDVDNTNHAGLRWYELTNTGSGWSIAQEGTYAPDAHSRWEASIAMNDFGQIALGYNVSSSSMSPEMRFCGQSSCAPNGVMDIAETSIPTALTPLSQGTGSYRNRWGDYSLMTVDPTDNLTFWYTTEYWNNGKKTQISSFTLDEACNAPSISTTNPTSLYKDRGKEITLTGSDFLGCTAVMGGITGITVSNNGSTWVIYFPPGDYSNGNLVVSNAVGSDNTTITINTRTTIPVDASTGVNTDIHLTIDGAVDGLHAWLGTSVFTTDYIIDVTTGTYTEGVSLNSELNPTSANTLTIQNSSGTYPVINATGNNYGFDLSTVDYVQLTGFAVHSADEANIYVQGDDCEVYYNKVYDGATADGIKLETGTTNNIHNNLIYNNERYAVHIASSNSNNIENNTTYTNGGTNAPLQNVELWNEDFEGSTAGWTLNAPWAIYSGNSHTGTYYLAALKNSAATTAFSPSVSISGYNNIEVSFWYLCTGNDAGDHLTAFYNIDGAGDVQFFDITGSQAAYTYVSTSIPATGNNIVISFKTNNGNNEYSRVDDIIIIGDEDAVAGNIGSELYVESGTGTTVENNIFYVKNGADYYTVQTEAGITIASDYNTYYANGNTNLFNYQGTPTNVGPISGNDITTDPDFVNAGTDYHINSTGDSYHGGEWPPLTASSGTWTTDGSDSPAIDAGNPADPFANEPANNGGVVNQGAYGNTLQASKSGASCTYPSTQAHTFTSTPNINSILAGWTRGNGNAVLVVARQGSAVNQDPSDGVNYTDNAAFGSGTQIGTGNYVVYNGTGTSVNVTALTASTTYHFALYEYTTAGYCYLVPELTGNSTTTAPATFSWTGSGGDNNWQNTANWSSAQIPTSSDDVTLANGNSPYPVIDNGISTVAVCNNISISNTASLTIDVDGYMTVSGTITNSAGNVGLVINSDVSGTGSLIQNTSGGVDATVNCHLASAAYQWHMIASPVTNAPFSVFSSTSNFYYYDESTADYWTGTSYDAGSTMGWTTPTGNMNVAQGYINYLPNETVTYTGQLYDNTSTGSITINYTDHGTNAPPPNNNNYDNYDGWNLIGNPYTSAIDWDDTGVAHGTANLLDAIYIYDDTNLHNYTSYVGGTSTNGGTRYIPAMQGFTVKGDATETGGTLSINTSARVHNNKAFWKENKETPDNFLRLKISANEYTDETVVKFAENATSEMDNGMDAYKLFTWNENVPQLYTNASGTSDYSINTLQDLSEDNISIPLKALQTGDTYTINVTEFSFTKMKVYLKDNLNNETVEIGLNDIIQLTAHDSDGIDRFELLFEKTTTYAPEALNTSVVLYPNPNSGIFYLTVGNNVSDYTVEISNVTGQLVYKNKFENNITKEINLNSQSAGIYFVKIKFSDKSVVNKKIVVE